MTPSPRAHWSVVDVAGWPCEVYSPVEPVPGRAVVHLHDLDCRPLGETPGLREAVEQARLPVLAPHTGRSWWLDRVVPAFDPRVTPERHVIDGILPEVLARFGVAPPQVALIGTGMGGQGALRLSYRHPGLFPVAAALRPAIDFHAAMRRAVDGDDDRYDTLWAVYGDVERARQDTAILHVHPLNWPRHQWFASDPHDPHWHDGAVRLHSKLAALGIPHTALLDARGSSAPDTVAVDAVRFVLAALDQESRRLA